MTRPSDASVGRIAWIDPTNGIAGDMLLGALLDAGASLAAVTGAVAAVLPGAVELRRSEVRRGGMRATKLDVDILAADQPHRDWRVIRELLSDADLADGVRRRALATFAALADAEGRAHGIDPEDVHFHEVGAWDSIADIVGVAAALDYLGLDALTAGTVGVGSGTMRTAHGTLPVPGPAVVELARGWPVAAVAEGELTTPTGMALLAALATPGPLPGGVVAAVGVGAGTRDDPGRPNVVRVLLLEPVAAPGRPGASRSGAPSEGGSSNEGGASAGREAVVLEANVDDLDPRAWPGILDALLAGGADDAWLTPILMKKGRPAHTLSVLCAPALAGALRERVLELTPTLGVREHRVIKHALDRTWLPVDVSGQPVRIKLGHDRGRIRTATPEYADVVAAALATGRAERELLAAAVAAAETAGLRPGCVLPG